MIKIWQVYIYIPINAHQEVNKCLATKIFEMLPITTTIDTSIHVYVHANTTHTHTPRYIHAHFCFVIFAVQ